MANPAPRVTHAYEGDVTLFLVGLRIHQPWRLDIVGRVSRAMGPMLVELTRDADELGYLGGRTVLDGLGPTVMTWWRSPEDLHRYAADGGRRHRPAWGAFYGYAAKAPRAVTIWHETYAVPAGGHESAYVGPKPRGLASIAGTVPIARRGERARERMRSGTAVDS